METVLDTGAARDFYDGNLAEPRLYVACYEPSQVLRILPDGSIERLIRDEEATCFATPLAWDAGT